MTSRPHTVLIVDDTLENLRVLGEMLEMDGHEVRIASQGAQALEMARLSPPDLILLDVMMPGMDGHEVCRRLKANPALAEIPVIFLTALNDESDEALGLDLGAVDYVTKPFKMNLVRKRIHNHLVLRQLQVAQKESNSRLEAQVAERTRELSEANLRLQALDSTKSLFLKLISQEVQAPAHGLVGIGQLALQGIADAEKRQRLQGLFETNRNRLDAIFQQYQRLVALQEAGPGARLHPVRLEEALFRAWTAVRDRAEAKGLHLDLPRERSFIVAADPELLVQGLEPVLSLLVDQARGTSTLACGLREAPPWVELTLTVPSDSPPGPSRALEEGKGPESLALPAVVLGAFGARGTYGSGPGSSWEVRITLGAYRP